MEEEVNLPLLCPQQKAEPFPFGTDSINPPVLPAPARLCLQRPTEGDRLEEIWAGHPARSPSGY
jgi:hypothetical protein